MWITIYIICLIIGLLICIYCNKKRKRFFKIDEDFRHSLNKVSNKFQKEKEHYIKHEKEEIKKQIDDYKKTFNLTDEDYKQQLNLLKTEYENTKNGIIELNKVKITEISDKYTQDLMQQRQAAAEQEQIIKQNLEAAEEQYKNKMEELNSYYTEQTKSLNSIIETKKKEVSNLIKLLKKEEENKHLEDFYRIVLSEESKEDINHIKSLAFSLHNPSILYKLIWETYVKNGFNLMIGRVLGIDKTDACGIYKITNIDSGKCYIGQTRAGFKNRWKTHVRRGVKAEEGTSNKLYEEMWKDGIDRYAFSIVEIIDKTEVERINEREKFYIDFYDSMNFGYNSRKG